MASEVEFIFQKGITFERNMTYRVKDGDAIDLSGAVLKFYLHKGRTAILTLASNIAPTASDTKIAVTDAALGEFTLKVADEDTRLLTRISDAKWYITFETGGNIKRIAGGKARIVNP